MEEITKEIEKLIDAIDYEPLKIWVLDMFEALANMTEEDAELYQQYYEHFRKRCEESQKEIEESLIEKIKKGKGFE